MSTAAPAPPISRYPRLRFVARWGWRGVKAVALLALLLIVLGVGWMLWTNYRGAAAADRVRAKLADEGLLPAAAEAAEELPDAENGARLYLAASRAVALDEAYKLFAPVVGFADWPLDGEAFSDEQRDVLQKILEPNREALAMARRGRDYDRYDYGFDETRRVAWTTERVSDLRGLARWIEIDSYLSLAEGDHAGAAASVADVFTLSDSIAGEPGMLVHLVRVSIGAMGRGLAESTLGRATLDDETLGTMQKAVQRSIEGYDLNGFIDRLLSDIGRRIDDPDALASDTLAAATGMQQVWREVAKLWSDEGEIEPDAWWETAAWRATSAYLLACPGTLQVGMADEVDYFLDARRRIRAGQVLGNDFDELSKEQGFELGPALSAAQRHYWHGLSELLTLSAALDAERFRLREGRWPADMREAVGDQPLPLDPWGRPLRLMHTKTGIRVYTLGVNGVDEGGITRMDPESVTDTEDDYHSDLIDPDRRGRPSTVTDLAGEDPGTFAEMLESMRGSDERDD